MTSKVVITCLSLMSVQETILWSWNPVMFRLRNPPSDSVSPSVISYCNLFFSSRTSKLAPPQASCPRIASSQKHELMGVYFSFSVLHRPAQPGSPSASEFFISFASHPPVLESSRFHVFTSFLGFCSHTHGLSGILSVFPRAGLESGPLLCVSGLLFMGSCLLRCSRLFYVFLDWVLQFCPVFSSTYSCSPPPLQESHLPLSSSSHLFPADAMAPGIGTKQGVTDGGLCLHWAGMQTVTK